MRPTISVVIAAKNEEKHVREAVESILAQKGVQFELIFIDDGSTDRTSEIVLSVAQEAGGFRLESSPSVGKVAAFNYGVSLARGDWVCLFAGDDVMPEGALAERWRAVRDVRSPLPVIGLCRLITMSTVKSQDGHVVPRSPKKGAWSGVSYLFDRRAAAKLFPIPETLPNEDTWLEVAVQHFDFRLVHSPVIGTKWRVHTNNSINFLLSYSEFNRRLTPRMVAAALFLELHGPELSAAKRRALIARVNCEEGRKAGNPVAIMTSGAHLVERLRALALSGPVLYGIRRRLYGLLSGW